MVHTARKPEPVGDVSSMRELYLRAFQLMVLARVMDDKFASLYRAGKIHGGVFLGRGQEALSVSVGLALREGDIFAPLIRDQAGRLAFGESILDAVRTYLGSALGPMRGRDGNIHRGRPQEGLLAMISHLGAMISVVNGALLARRMKGVSGIVGVASCGDGATSTGAFHEAMNQAGVEKLPLVMVVADNQFAYSTPTPRQFACKNLLDRALAYGFQGHAVDGTDLNECLKIAQEAVTNAREGRGPQLIVARLLRLCGHGEHDDSHYVNPMLKNTPSGRDCLKVSEEFLREQGMADSAALDRWRGDAVQQLEDTIAKVNREPSPDPFKENWYALSAKHLCEGTQP
jgi:acetoin:2,6-dichlorophenolindophenol oxidoreductase subunit alpha